MAPPSTVTEVFAECRPGGVLSFRKLVFVLGELCPDLNEDAVKLLWDQQAKRKDGDIDVSRFLSYLYADSDLKDPSTMCLRSLSTAMSSEEQRNELRALFDMLDANADGKVSSKEWGHSLSRNKDALAKYFGGSTMSEVGKAFKRIDIDKSKDLSWEEFVGASEEFAAAFQIADVMATEDGRTELKALFDTLDKDANGKVSSKEWGHSLTKNKDQLSKLFGGITLKELGNAFRRLDVNGDKDLSWEEFESAAAKLI